MTTMRLNDRIIVITGGTSGIGQCLARTLRNKNNEVIVLGRAGDDQIGDIADDVILVPKVDPFLQPILASVPLQLLAYHVADLKGTDVDQPRNLAKSVTVE